VSGYTVAPGVGWVLDGDTVVVAPPGTGQRLALEGTAVDVWLLVAEGLSRQDVVRTLQEQYQGDDDTIAHAAAALVDDLLTRNLLVDQHQEHTS
jgi:hypothetical protein